MKRRLLAFGLALLLLFSLTACASQEIQAEELTAGVHTGSHSGAMDFDGPETQLVNDFAVRIFLQTMERGRTPWFHPSPSSPPWPWRPTVPGGRPWPRWRRCLVSPSRR